MRRKISGRPLRPPTKWPSKSRLVLSWCIYTTKLERILAEISDADERLRAPPKAGLRLNKIFFHFFDFARAHFLFSIKEEENFVSAFCPNGQAEACTNVPLGRRGREGFKGRNAAPSSLCLRLGRLKWLKIKLFSIPKL
jgi:hypothetical protein